MEAFQNFLKLFPNYSEDLFDELSPYLSVRELEKNDYFLKEGQTCKQLAFIKKGMVRIYYLHDGKEITKCFCRENSITCSYSSMISQTPSGSAIQAVEDTTLITISYSSLQELYKKNMFWQQMGRIAGEQEYIVEESHNRSMRDLSASDRYKDILENDSELLQRVPLNHLASYMQVAPETLSRIRKKFARN